MPPNTVADRDTVMSAALGSNVDLACNHNLPQPVSYEWTREYVPLPSDVRTNEVCNEKLILVFSVYQTK